MNEIKMFFSCKTNKSKGYLYIRHFYFGRTKIENQHIWFYISFNTWWSEKQHNYADVDIYLVLLEILYGSSYGFTDLKMKFDV